MKYLKRYEKFMEDVLTNINYNIDSNLILVEKMVLKDFSISFWDMSLNSSVFTNEEKAFIKENLVDCDVDLINEGWFKDTMGAIVKKAKEAGSKIWNSVKAKINQIKDNIKNLVLGVTDFIKNFFKSINTWIKTNSNIIKQKVKNDFPKKLKELITTKKAEPNDLTKEFGEIGETYKFLQNMMNEGLFSKKIDSSDDKVISDAESEVGTLEQELKNESIRYDILKSFYLKEADEYKVGDVVKYKTNDNTELEKEITRVDGDKYYFKDKDGNDFFKTYKDIIRNNVVGTWSGFSKWFLEMEKTTPPKQGKQTWWVKLIVKIFSLILSPITKLIEGAVKIISSNILKGVSFVCKQLGGPGVFEFVALGGIIASIPSLVTEFSLISHKMPDPWSHIFEIVSVFLEEVPGISTILLIVGSICTVIAISELVSDSKNIIKTPSN